MFRLKAETTRTSGELCGFRLQAEYNHAMLGPLVKTAPARKPDRVALRGRYVTLEPLTAAQHGEALFACIGPGHDGLWTYMFDGPFRDRAAFDAALARWQTRDDPLSFAIVDKRTGKAAGRAALMRIDPRHRVIEVGSIVFSPPLQRTREGTEAMYLLARHVFEDLGYRRYEWKCNALNAASRTAAERLGFTFEGVFRSHMIVKGRSRDTAWFSIIDRDWPAIKARFEAWLSPRNFDIGGRQRTPLGGLSASGPYPSSRPSATARRA
jgi:RimJ/RimL family protein N-acetyltransferase